MITEVCYETLDMDVKQLGKAYFYKSTIPITDKYHEVSIEKDLDLISKKNTVVAKWDLPSNRVRDAIIGMSSIKDKVIVIA